MHRRCGGFCGFRRDRDSVAGFQADAYRNPPPESSPAFFWMWNDRLDVDRLCGQLDVMASNGIRNVCIHPVPKKFRPGIFQTEMESGLSDRRVS